MKKPRKQTTFKEDAGRLLLDLGKLVFGSIFLGGVLRGGISHVILSISGLAIAGVLCIIGLLLGTKERKE